MAARQRRRLTRQGRPIPAEYFPPKVLAGYEAWLELFWEISTNRSVGMTFGDIPSLAIEFYIDRYSISDPDEFRFCIRAMDRAYRGAISRSDEDEETLSPESIKRRGK